MAIDVNEVIEQLLRALNDELGEDFETISALSKEQARRLATQASMIFQSRATGSLKDNDDLFDFFINQLEEMVENFTRTVANLTILTVEKAWNAVVKVIWGAINTALGAAGLAILPIPGSPSI